MTELEGFMAEKQKVTTANCTRRYVFKYRCCKVSQAGDRICILHENGLQSALAFRSYALLTKRVFVS